MNPAVTVAVCASGRNKCKAYPDGACYVGAQVAGGLLASGQNSQKKIKKLKNSSCCKFLLNCGATLCFNFGDICTAFYVNIANMTAFDLG